MSDKLYIPIYVIPDKQDKTKEFRNCPIRVLPDDKQEGEEFRPVTHDIVSNVEEKRYYCSNFGRIWDSYNQQYLPFHFNTPYSPDEVNHGYKRTKMTVYTSEYETAVKDVYIHKITGLTYADKDVSKDDVVGFVSGNDINADNLIVSSKQESINRHIKLGNMKVGLDRSTSVIKDEQTLLNIIEDLKNEVPMTDIAEKYDVGRGTVYKIKNKETYTEYTKDIDFNKRTKKKGLSDEQVIAICEQLEVRQTTGKSLQEIANELGVTRDNVKDINLGRNYRHISSKYSFV